MFYGPLAQLVEQQTLNLRVEGSIPSRLKTAISYVIRNCETVFAIGRTGVKAP